MTLKELKTAVDAGNDFYFTYDGLNAGVECTVINSVATFSAWYGEIEKTYNNLNHALTDPIYHGHSIKELLNSKAIDIRFS